MDFRALCQSAGWGSGTAIYLVYISGGLSPLTNVTVIKEPSPGSENEDLHYFAATDRPRVRSGDDRDLRSREQVGRKDLPHIVGLLEERKEFSQLLLRSGGAGDLPISHRVRYNRVTHQHSSKGG